MRFNMIMVLVYLYSNESKKNTLQKKSDTATMLNVMSWFFGTKVL